MNVLCLDLEGVLVPEIWINVAERTGIEALQLTTRDIPDYDELMQHRLRVLAEHDLRMPLMQEVIAGMGPMDGAKAFLDDMRTRWQVLILSDTFYEFGMPMMAQLGYPTLLCHKLLTDSEGRLTGYQLRQPDPKRASVKALHDLQYRVVAAGDSYNDTAMLEEADAGILFRAPANVVAQFPQYPLVTSYDALRDKVEAALA